MIGNIHSFQSLGAVDGPGLRSILFLQGCPLRCVYCHNPDTWALETADTLHWSVEETVGKILRYRPYHGFEGGVTVSGGEPLLQATFVSSLFQSLRQEGIHTALDTSGIGDPNGADLVLPHTDLVLCDLKFSNETDYRSFCGGELDSVIKFLHKTKEYGISLWIRHVVVPGFTDSEGSKKEIERIAALFPNLERIEFLPYRRLGLEKYEAMGIRYPLDDVFPSSSIF
jgi:pyruvate formate lyase activating enzyme